MRRKTQTANSKSGARARVQRGFTFMELLIVMVIIAIMAAVAIPRFLTHLKRAKEVVLMQNLWTMRRAIDFYWQDKEKPPSTLDELVAAGYLREVPKDPMCSDCQWNQLPAPADDSNSAGGIGDVKSSAPGEDSNGKPFTDY
ncbi:MAG TPA: prepilin-type N-terminal cleavage/methylation domain-containing protein [Blastocatellia bacterium]|nr:prepilin-type N-terminal cleavage/methylation domain-containing protein [Blastocatellia bacterium]